MLIQELEFSLWRCGAGRHTSSRDVDRIFGRNLQPDVTPEGAKRDREPQEIEMKKAGTTRNAVEKEIGGR
jgi:hypothetical protein